MRFPSTDEEYIIAGVIALLMILIFIFRKWISYLYCPLEKYEGKGYGKSHYLFVVHIISSAFVSITIFIYSSNSLDLIDYFESNPYIRISVFISLFLLTFLSIGFIIDKYLIATDKIYKDWKMNKKNRKKAANSKL